MLLVVIRLFTVLREIQSQGLLFLGYAQAYNCYPRSSGVSPQVVNAIQYGRLCGVPGSDNGKTIIGEIAFPMRCGATETGVAADRLLPPKRHKTGQVTPRNFFLKSLNLPPPPLSIQCPRLKAIASEWINLVAKVMHTGVCG